MHARVSTSSYWTAEVSSLKSKSSYSLETNILHLFSFLFCQILRRAKRGEKIFYFIGRCSEGHEEVLDLSDFKDRLGSVELIY